MTIWLLGKNVRYSDHQSDILMVPTIQIVDYYSNGSIKQRAELYLLMLFLPRIKKNIVTEVFKCVFMFSVAEAYWFSPR